MEQHKDGCKITGFSDGCNGWALLEGKASRALAECSLSICFHAPLCGRKRWAAMRCKEMSQVQGPVLHGPSSVCRLLMGTGSAPACSQAKINPCPHTSRCRLSNVRACSKQFHWATSSRICPGLPQEEGMDILDIS